MNIVKPPMYNLGKNLVISEITKDGILVSSVKRILNSETGVYTDDYVGV